MKRRIWIPIVLLLLTVGAVFALTRPREAPALEVSTVPATRGLFERESKATGSIEARIYTLTFPKPGRVATVLAKEGQAVPKGALLARLDTSDDEAKLQSSRSSLESIRVRLGTSANETSANRGKLETALANARRKLAASRQLFAVGGAAQSEVDEATRAVGDLEAQLSVLSSQGTSGQSDLQAQRAARESEIEALERSIAQAALRSPVAGTVAKVDFLPGTESGQGAVRLVEDATLTVRARLAEADASFVKPGQPARIELDAALGRPLSAKVDRLGVQGEVQSQGSSAVLPVVLRFLDPNAKGLARPGLTAVARITTLRIPDATLVPLEAIVEENKRFYAWTVAETKTGDRVQLTARKVPLTVKARNLTHAAVTGLEPGAKLVSLPPEALKEGDALREAAKEPAP